MFQNYLLLILVVFSITQLTSSLYINDKHPKPWKVMNFPKGSLFLKSDLIDNGCSIFITKCPSVYKNNFVCARHYDGKYRTFNTYCDMELENCNSWRQWSMVKGDRC